MGEARQKRKAQPLPQKEGGGKNPSRTIPRKLRQHPTKSKPQKEQYDPLGFPAPAKKPGAEGEPSLGDDPLGEVYLPNHPKRKNAQKLPNEAQGKKGGGAASAETSESAQTMWRAPPVHFSKSALQWLRIEGVDIQRVSGHYNEALKTYNSLEQNPPEDSLDGWHALSFWAGYCGVMSLGHSQELESVRGEFAKAYPKELASFDNYLSKVKASSREDMQNEKRAHAQEERIKLASGQTQ